MSCCHYGHIVVLCRVIFFMGWGGVPFIEQSIELVSPELFFK